MSRENEKRRSERIPGRFRVEVREKLATWITSTEDVSARGCRIAMERPLVPGMLVHLAFDMGEGRDPLVAIAQVAWVRRAPPQSAGLALLSVPREAKHPQPGFWIDRLRGSPARAIREAPRPLATARAGSGEAIILPPVA